MLYGQRGGRIYFPNTFANRKSSRTVWRIKPTSPHPSPSTLGFPPAEQYF